MPVHIACGAPDIIRQETKKITEGQWDRGPNRQTCCECGLWPAIQPPPPQKA